MSASASPLAHRQPLTQETIVTPRPIPAAGLMLAATLFAGCASTQPPPTSPPSATELDAMTPSDVVISEPPIVPEVEPAKPLSPLDDPNNPLYKKVIYFDYDTAEIPQNDVSLLKLHAGYLYNTPGASVTLEGHTDERGTRGYNLALGDRRADAVQKFLVAEGVPPAKLSRLSYGEERPADPASGERAWALNRRVELVY
jgi:peptidoglycan-associated lipoprotein